MRRKHDGILKDKGEIRKVFRKCKIQYQNLNVQRR